MLRGFRNLFSERAEGSDEPDTYEKVRIIEIDDTTAQIASDEGEFTVYDVTDFRTSALPKVEVSDVDYNIDQRTFYIQFKDFVAVRAKKGREGVQLVVVA